MKRRVNEKRKTTVALLGALSLATVLTFGPGETSSKVSPGSAIDGTLGNFASSNSSRALAVTNKTAKLPQPAAVKEVLTQGTQMGPSHNGGSTQFDIDWDTPNDRDEVITAPATGTAYIHHDSTDFGNHINLDVGPADPNNPGGPRHFWVMAHNKTFLIKNGQHVEMGQPIAMEGCTGTCFGDHTHFGLHLGDPQHNAGHSTSVNDALILSRDVTAGESSFSSRRPTEFKVNNRYESNNHYPEHTLTNTDWGFANDSRFWHLGPNGGASTIGFNSPGAWILEVRNDPSIVSPLLDIQASTFSAIEITMASQATDTLGAVYFATLSSPNFSDEKVFTFSVVPGGGYHTIRVPLTGNSAWQGRITRLRVDPVGNATGQAVGIQRIRLIGDTGGAIDEIPPQLSVTSHSDGQTVSTNSILLSGTATDNGRGESGISSVTVNGSRANGDTATGSDVANWSLSLPLNLGSNSITVQARDSSQSQNMTQRTLTIVRSDISSCPVTTISLGQTLTGALSTSDCIYPGTNKYYDLYSFNGAIGQQIRASQDSSGFDTYLYLTNSANQVIAEDNNSGTGTNSRIPGSGFFTLPSNDTYYLWASSANNNATGSYSISLSQCSFSISSHENTVGPGTGSTNFLMDTSTGCNWSAVSDSPSWLTTSSTGVGDGTVRYDSAANNSTNPRVGKITVGGQIHTVTQIGLGGAGSIQFSSSTYSTNENSGEVTITVTRTGGTHTGTVQYSTSNASATAGNDYAATSGTLLFGPNEMSKTFTISIIDDTSSEGNEAINLSLANQSLSLSLGSPSAATLTVIDNDTPLAPVANSATTLTRNTFTANWSAFGGAAGYYLDVSTTSLFNSFVKDFQNLDVGNVSSYGVGGLSASTTYYYRVRAYSATGISANSNIVSASTAGPMIFIEEGTANRAVALDSATWLRGPFRVLNLFNFTTDHRTRVILFTSDLGLNQPDPSQLNVQAGGVSLAVESVGPVNGMSASYIIVRFPDGLPAGDLSLVITLRGLASINSPTLSIAP